MVRITKGTDKAAEIPMRRVKSASSGKGAVEGVIGSSAMPHLGQVPGVSWTTSGSIGQV